MPETISLHPTVETAQPDLILSNKAFFKETSGELSDLYRALGLGALTLTEKELAEFNDSGRLPSETVSGIQQRHVLKPNESLGDLARQVLDQMDWVRDETTGLILSTQTAHNPDSDITNQMASYELVMQLAEEYDMHALVPVLRACAGAPFAIDEGKQELISNSKIQRVVVLMADAMFRYIAKPATHPDLPEGEIRNMGLFGDGAGAVVLEKDGGENSLTVLEAHFPEIPDKVRESVQSALYEDGRGYLRMSNGGAIMKQAIRNMSLAGIECLEKNEIPAGARVFVVPHQANGRILSGVENGIQKKYENVSVINQISDMGNTGAASVALATAKSEVIKAMQEHKAETGEEVYLLWIGFGTGPNLGAQLFKF